MNRLMYLGIALFTLLACQVSQNVKQSTQATPQAIINPTKNNDATTRLTSFLSKDEILKYKSFEIAKRKKFIRDKEVAGGKYDASYIVIKKENKIIATFDGLYHPIGNTAAFGLYSFLGNQSKQLIIELSIPRSSKYWIADVSNNFNVIFSSDEWQIDREELSMIDLDKDGIYELETLEPWWMVFEQLPMSATPHVAVLFKYDVKRKKFLPANHLFKHYMLEGIDDDIEKLDNTEASLSACVRLLLEYLYAGEEKVGWEFFDHSYQAQDKAKVKTTIKNALKNSPIYQYIRANDGK